MIGALYGDIVGSIYEWNNIKQKDFWLYQSKMFFTDDTVMTLAVAKSLLEYKDKHGDLQDLVVKNMQYLGRKYPHAGYGERFQKWLWDDNPKPYESYGNGAAMRVSACGWVGKTLAEVKDLSYDVTAVTHNHPEGVNGAEAVAVAIFMARTGSSKEEIAEAIRDEYYPLDKTLDEIRPYYTYDVTCQGSVPQAIQAFLESTDFEDAIRNAVSLGGDSDTIAAITGSIAEAFYGVTKKQIEFVFSKLDDDLSKIHKDFQKFFMRTIVRNDIYNLEDLTQEIIRNGRYDADRRHFWGSIHTVTNLLNGFRPGELYVLGGRPGMGRTELILSIIKDIHGDDYDRQARVAYFTYRSHPYRLAECYLANVLNITVADIECPDDVSELKEYQEKLGYERIKFINSIGYGVYRIRETLKTILEQHNVDVVIIDSYQVLEQYTDKNKLNELSLELKQLAVDLDVVVLVMSDLDDVANVCAGHKPGIADLSNAGFLAHDADVVMLLHREAYYNHECVNPNCAEVIIAKNKMGRIGTAVIDFDRKKRIFKEHYKQKGK